MRDGDLFSLFGLFSKRVKKAIPSTFKERFAQFVQEN
jgi:hypothetical protein